MGVVFEGCGIGLGGIAKVAGGGVDDLDFVVLVGLDEVGDALSCLDGEAGSVFEDGLEFRVEFRVVAGGGEVAHC